MTRESDVRPWGSWHVLDAGPGYQVKRLQVTPGQRLSLQTHARRSESWIVVAGVATCTVGEDTRDLGPGASVDVAIGEPHRIANEGDAEVIIIEVQRGDYLGEDDICRLEDDYGRTR